MKKILIISNKSVFPALDGGALAIKNLSHILVKQNYKIDIVAISKKYDKDQEVKPASSTPYTNINYILFHINMEFNAMALIKSIIKSESYQVNRFYNKKIKHFIQKKINQENYSIIIFESLFSMIYRSHLTIKDNIKTILRAHNIEHKIWNNLSKNSSNIIKKLIYLFLSYQIKIIEDHYPKTINHIVTISSIDEEYFKTLHPQKTHYLPVTFEIEEKKIPKIERSIVHLGSMDWKPNIEGINWFMKNVHPILKDENIKIFIAGKKMPKYFFQKNEKNLFIEGGVEDAKKYINNKHILFVPLLSGSGIRIKILESMALGMPVVSTSKGAEGIPYEHGVNILIANTALEFKESIMNLINDSNLALYIGHNGRELIKSKFSNNFVIKKWNQIIKK
jgi:glycosyltransferase involved in cell wall biosynthesis